MLGKVSPYFPQFSPSFPIFLLTDSHGFVNLPVLLRMTGPQFSPLHWRPLELGLRTPTLRCG